MDSSADAAGADAALGGKARGRGSGRGAGGERSKELVVKLFGEEHILGTFPTRLHSDLLHLVEMLRRGKLPRLAAERLSALEAALALPDSLCTSVTQLRQQIEVWREGGRRAFDADRYYDGDRAVGYTEHNRGPQQTLARRALQLCSLATESTASMEGATLEKESLLAVDLGCGSGLSTAESLRLPMQTVGTIGIDLSSEMLRSEEWQEVASLPAPMAGERLRCDLGQPLPFRAGVFDLAYSISAVHYLVQDSVTRSADQRISALTSSLRRCMSSTARPCVLQAYMTRESAAVEKFSKVARQDGWAVCDLVVDQAHAGPAERDFLYLLDGAKAESACRPPRCALYRHAGATCALAMEAWTRSSGLPPVMLDGSHRAWLGREHDRWARRMVRLHRRCGTDGATLDHASPLGREAELEAERLRLALEKEPEPDGAETKEEAKQRHILNILHGAES